MSSLWDSRFTNDKGSQVVLSSAELERNTNLKISSILGFAGRRLPLVQPHQLSFHKHLGAGTSFKVDCESYSKFPGDKSLQLVAVKYMRIGLRSEHTAKSLYDVAMREIRVLTHSPLMNHEHVTSAMAYGWFEDSSTGVHPYLVVDYSDHGTLTDYLKRTNQSLNEMRELALDVAFGLQALHNSKIIHGDVKASNVLVFDSNYLSPTIPQVAKLADFGAAIFEVDFDEGPISYKGTTMYNAPEQEGWSLKYGWEAVQTKEMFYKADIYSFGLLLWEIIKHGDKYFDPGWLTAGESDIHFLERICRIEEDGMLHRAISYCKVLFSKMPLSVNDESKTPHAILKVLEATLRDNPYHRLDINSIVDLIAEGTEMIRPKTGLPSVRNHFLGDFWAGTTESPATGVHAGPGKAGVEISLFEIYGKDLFKPSWKKPTTNSERVSKMPHQINQYPRPQAKRVSGPSEKTFSASNAFLPDPFPYRAPSTLPGIFKMQKFNLLQISAEALLPPWKIQCSVFDEIRHSIEKLENFPDLLERGEACFQLSVCYHIGFGVEPSVHEMFRYLKEALPDSLVAQSVYAQIVAAIGHKTTELNLQHGFGTDADKELASMNLGEAYFSERFRKSQKLLSQASSRKVWEIDGMRFSLQNLEHLDILLHKDNANRSFVSVDGPGRIFTRTNLLELLAEIGSSSSISRIFLDRPCSDEEISVALNSACKNGHFDPAITLANQCQVFIHHDNNEPTPLHWLIMFDENECYQLARCLMLGSSGTDCDVGGPCKALINEMPPSGSEPTQFPLHCLRLSGSPLHWAVASRNLPLVKTLIELGANPTIFPSDFLGSGIESSEAKLYNGTPLEVALICHLPEIVGFFLCHKKENAFYWENSIHKFYRDRFIKTLSESFHLISLYAVPFSRYIVHGSQYRSAMKQTINMLLDSGYDVNQVDELGETAFMVALSNPDQDTYILEELLAAGAQANFHAPQSGKNALSIIASSMAKCPYQIDKFALVLPYATNPNHLDNFGYNALHYLAIHDAGTIVKLLLQDPRLDMNARASRRTRDTALHIAATFGSVKVLQLLLEANAPIEIRDQDDRTPLEIAILCRRKEAIDILLAKSASTLFDVRDEGPRSTALHSAVAGPSYPGSIARYLLENHSVLRASRLANMFDKYGWTPLHKATYYGDNESVIALLSFGADHAAVCTHPFPIAPGKTALDVVENLIKGLHTASDLCYYHDRIRKGGDMAFNKFIHSLAEIRRTLEAQVMKKLD